MNEKLAGNFSRRPLIGHPSRPGYIRVIIEPIPPRNRCRSCHVTTESLFIRRS